MIISTLKSIDFKLCKKCMVQIIIKDLCRIQYFSILFVGKPLTQKAGVQYILDSVVDALRKDSNRRYVYMKKNN